MRQSIYVLATLAVVCILTSSNAARGQGVLDAYGRQQEQRRHTQKICEEQYRRAAYLSKQGYYAGGGVGGLYRLMLTNKGVQAISPMVIQRADGSFQCERGEYAGYPFRYFAKPLLLDQEHERLGYKGLPNASCGAFNIAELERLGRHECLTKYVYLIRLEECGPPENPSAKCLFVYTRIINGPVRRELLGASRSIQEYLH
jgi:hypothetical protein